MKQSIELKNSDVLAALMLAKYHPTLIAVLRWFYKKYGVMFITEGYRVALHPGDVHSTDPVRAADVRSHMFDNPYQVQDEINAEWCYDSRRPQMMVCVYHGDTPESMHFHIQVHPNTQRRIKQ